jgi:hypothetical protein
MKVIKCLKHTFAIKKPLKNAKHMNHYIILSNAQIMHTLVSSSTFRVLFLPLPLPPIVLSGAIIIRPIKKVF